MQLADVMDRLRVGARSGETVVLSNEEARALFVLFRALAEVLVQAGLAGDFLVETGQADEEKGRR
jgi:hypothetical protein